MNPKIITLSLLKIIEEMSSENPAIASTYSKVRSILRKYAASKSIKISELRITDLYNEDGTLQIKIMKFISRLDSPKKRTPVRHKLYKEEARSNLNRLFRLINGIDSALSEKFSKQSFLEANTPDLLKSVICLLPRSKSLDERLSVDIQKLNLSSRTMMPLTESAQYVLRILIEVTERYQPDTLEELFNTYNSELRITVKKTAPSKKWNSIDSIFIRLRKLLNIKIIKPQNKGLVLSEFPPTLKKQWEIFEKRAGTGWVDNQEMISLAAMNGIKLKKLEKTTIRNYYQAISIALPYIPYEKDLDVKDLLRLEVIEAEIDGVLTIRHRNSFVDAFREHERKRKELRKRVGFDSATFEHFLTCIKTIAAYNGIFHLQKAFRKEYLAILDKESLNKRKTAKKQVFSLEWLDRVIGELEAEFIKIVKENKFKLENPNYRKSELVRSLRFCLFYVSFVTLRYLGFRQQCIRNCVYHRNIVFYPEGAIFLRWDSDETKNDVLLEVTLDPEKHSRAHGRLIRILTLYHEKIYKYLRKKHSKSMNKQFFLKLDSSYRPCGFMNDDPTDYYSRFVNACRSYIKMEEVVCESALNFTPHSLRGIAADWYFTTIGMSLDKTAKILGDSPATLESEYLRRDQHIVTPVLDEANMILEQRDNQSISLTDSSLTQAEDLSRAIERADLVEKQLETLTEQLGSANQQIIFLQEQVEQSNNEVLEQLKALSKETE